MTDRSAGDTAPVLPADFWEQPEIRSALLSRHFGRFLRVYRMIQSSPVKQDDVARWLGIMQGQLSKIERSSTPVQDLAKLDRWARALHVPADLLWFSQSPDPSAAHDAPPTHEAPPTQEAPPPRATVEAAEQSEGSAVYRRDLFKAAGVTAATVGTGLLSATPWQRLIDSVNEGRPVDTATVQLMQDRTADFFHTEETVPACQLLDSLTQHRSTLKALLANARIGAIRDQLAVAIGETDALTGWLLFDLGRGNEAANAWRSTLKIAKEARDGALAACALGYWSYLAASRNDIAPAVRLLRQAAEYVPGSSAPATRSWISAREAEELARLGDETASLRAVERALTAFDFARPRFERPWTAFFGVSRLGSMTVSTYTTLHHREADVAADSLLASLSPTDNKVRAIVLPILQPTPSRRKNTIARMRLSRMPSNSRTGPRPLLRSSDS